MQVSLCIYRVKMLENIKLIKKNNEIIFIIAMKTLFIINYIYLCKNFREFNKKTIIFKSIDRSTSETVTNIEKKRHIVM